MTEETLTDSLSGEDTQAPTGERGRAIRTGDLGADRPWIVSGRGWSRAAGDGLVAQGSGLLCGAAGHIRSQPLGREPRGARAAVTAAGFLAQNRKQNPHALSPNLKECCTFFCSLLSSFIS